MGTTFSKVTSCTSTLSAAIPSAKRIIKKLVRSWIVEPVSALAWLIAAPVYLSQPFLRCLFDVGTAWLNHKGSSNLRRKIWISLQDNWDLFKDRRRKWEKSLKPLRWYLKALLCFFCLCIAIAAADEAITAAPMLMQILTQDWSHLAQDWSNTAAAWALRFLLVVWGIYTNKWLRSKFESMSNVVGRQYRAILRKVFPSLSVDSLDRLVRCTVIVCCTGLVLGIAYTFAIDPSMPSFRELSSGIFHLLTFFAFNQDPTMEGSSLMWRIVRLALAAIIWTSVTTLSYLILWALPRERHLRQIEESFTDRGHQVWASQFASNGQYQQQVLYINGHKYELRKKKKDRKAYYSTAEEDPNHDARLLARNQGIASVGRHHLYLIGWTRKSHQEINQVCTELIQDWEYDPWNHNCQHFIRLVADSIVDERSLDWGYFRQVRHGALQNYLFDWWKIKIPITLLKRTYQILVFALNMIN